MDQLIYQSEGSDWLSRFQVTGNPSLPPHPPTSTPSTAVCLSPTPFLCLRYRKTQHHAYTLVANTAVCGFFSRRERRERRERWWWW